MSSRILVGIVVVLVLLSCGGCITLSGVDGNPLEVEKNDRSYFVQEYKDADQVLLKALVKGSIYETGEAVSVFGTCLDGDDLPINGTLAKLSAWYPNGTIFFSDVNMTEIAPSYFVYQGSMNAVEGTYLTELTCSIYGRPEIAKAFGEWQNPQWVKKIGQINETVGDITIQIGNLSVQMNESFEITWDKIDSVNATVGDVYNNLSNDIYIVGQIANNSVDRNDSYIVYLLNQLITGIPDGNVTLTWNETASSVIYYRDWTMYVDVFNSAGLEVQWPLVACYINTTNNPPTVNQLMEWKNSCGSHDIGDDVGCYQHIERVKVKQGFTWNVNCVYN